MRSAMYLLAALGLFACEGAKDDEANLGECGTEYETWVVTDILFARKVDGVTEGFDLDGQVSEVGGTTGCGHGDLMSPEGESGVDNNFAGLIPVLEATEAEAVEGLIQASINSGELLLMFDLDGMDSWDDDSCVDMTMYRASGAPLLGTDGAFLEYQTFEPHETIEPVPLGQQAIADGTVEARGFEMNLPMSVLAADLDFHVTQAALRLTRTEEGLHGVLGGAIRIEQFMEIAQRPDVNIDPAVLEIVWRAADMLPDENGECQGLSLSLEFHAVPAYLTE